MPIGVLSSYIVFPSSFISPKTNSTLFLMNWHAICSYIGIEYTYYKKVYNENIFINNF